MKVADLLEKIELAEPDEAEASIGWYVLKGDADKISAGPYESVKAAKHDMQFNRWYNSGEFDFAHGWVDDNDVFHEMEPDPVSESLLTNKFIMKVSQRGGAASIRTLNDADLSKLSNEFLSNAEKNKVRRLEPGAEAVFKHENSSGDLVTINITYLKK